MIFRRATNISHYPGAAQSRDLNVLYSIGKMGLAFHEMYKVSGLVNGDAPYEVKDHLEGG